MYSKSFILDFFKNVLHISDYLVEICNKSCFIGLVYGLKKINKVKKIKLANYILKQLIKYTTNDCSVEKEEYWLAKYADVTRKEISVKDYYIEPLQLFGDIMSKYDYEEIVTKGGTEYKIRENKPDFKEMEKSTHFVYQDKNEKVIEKINETKPAEKVYEPQPIKYDRRLFFEDNPSPELEKPLVKPPKIKQIFDFDEASSLYIRACEDKSIKEFKYFDFFGNLNVEYCDVRRYNILKDEKIKQFEKMQNFMKELKANLYGESTNSKIDEKKSDDLSNDGSTLVSSIKN